MKRISNTIENVVSSKPRKQKRRSREKIKTYNLRSGEENIGSTTPSSNSTSSSDMEIEPTVDSPSTEDTPNTLLERYSNGTNK